MPRLAAFWFAPRIARLTTTDNGFLYRQAPHGLDDNVTYGFCDMA